MAATGGTGAGPGRSTAATCTSCGAVDDGLVSVRRVYLTVDDAGRVTGSETMADPEWWCQSCRSLYPHDQVSGDGDEGGGPPQDPRGS
jgi:hypothetical protein